MEIGVARVAEESEISRELARNFERRRTKFRNRKDEMGEEVLYQT